MRNLSVYVDSIIVAINLEALIPPEWGVIKIAVVTISMWWWH